jgi:endonuclease/exonuclease/phosphatase family metal-dependent hydrolase
MHFGIIIFSKYPIVNKRTVSYYPHDYNSIFQYADIVKNKDTIRVFNVHLQSLKFSRSNLHYIDSPSLKTEADLEKTKNVIGKLKTGFLKRHTQADRIRAEIDKSPYPVIICGDFNDVPNSYASMTIGNGLKNAFVEKGYGLGRTFSGIAPTLRIDNIFTDKTFSIQQFTRINKRLSDHFPIIADITHD